MTSSLLKKKSETTWGEFWFTRTPLPLRLSFAPISRLNHSQFQVSGVPKMPRMSTGGNGTATDLKANYKHRPPKLVNTKLQFLWVLQDASMVFPPCGVFDRWKILFAPPTKCLILYQNPIVVNSLLLTQHISI